MAVWSIGSYKLIDLKLVADVLTVARVTAGLAESNGSLPPVYDSRHPQADCQEPGTLCSVVEYGLFLLLSDSFFGLQCFDAVGWAAGRASGL